MSGSSRDGLDIAFCEFVYDTNWQYEIIASDTISYPEDWLIALKEMPKQSGQKLVEYDIRYGKYLGEQVNIFMDNYKIKPDIICSHGHTVFHNPKLHYTFQLGHGQAIASTTGIMVISDFRIGDIQLGGQGAPLVPIGDKLLFQDYDYCINIGGIANISFDVGNKRIALDICPANQLLNHLSKQLGKPYDENGSIAQLGKMNSALFDKLNNHPYYLLPYPKSMSNQLVVDTFIPIVDNLEASIEDKLYTVCKHIAYQTQKIIDKIPGQNILVTGGGTHNSFLITAIRKETQKKVTIPENDIIDFKEALIFAFLGVLRMENKINCLASATGATRDSSSGIIYNP